VSRSLLAVSLVLGSLAMQPAVAQEVEKACRAMSDTYATIDDATRCAQAHGWKVTRFWVQISEWTEPESGRNTRAERGERVSSVRIMCGAPAYVEENGVRNALWETKSISMRTGYERTSYSYYDDDGLKSFDFLDDAANAACGSLHLNARPRAPAAS
jgi:hypothetical protein